MWEDPAHHGQNHPLCSGLGVHRVEKLSKLVSMHAFVLSAFDHGCDVTRESCCHDVFALEL